MKKLTIRKMTQLALLATVALMLSYVESFIPAMPIPGAKVGLPNIISLVILYSFGFVEAIIIMVIRTVISSFLFSSPVTLMYSLAGGLLSISIMYLLIKLLKDKISIVAVSVIGAVAHNIAQLVVAMFVLETLSLATIVPWLIIIGVIAGIVVGYAAKYCLIYTKRLHLGE